MTCQHVWTPPNAVAFVQLRAYMLKRWWSWRALPCQKPSHASMAKSPNSKSNPHPFLCCFGFSGKHRRFKPLKPAAAHRKGPISWMRFHSKQPPPSPSVQFNLSNTDSDRLSSKSIAPAAAFNSNEDFTVAVPVATNRSGEEIVTRPENVCEFAWKFFYVV